MMTYDYAIIGGSLTGLIIGSTLARSGAKVVLIDGADFMGGMNRGVPSRHGICNNGLRFVPGGLLGEKALDFLAGMIPDLKYDRLENSPMIYESGELKPFLGFADQAPANYEELHYFLAPHELKPSLDVHAWVQSLISSYSGETMARSFVTQLQVTDNQVHTAMINGQKKIQAQNFIYCGGPADLQLILTEEILGHKTLAKLNKSPFVTAICLDVYSPPETHTNSNITVLHSIGQEENVTSLGRFHASTSEAQLSQWLTLIPSIDAEDAEAVGTSLRKMKRQIKRAFPKLGESMISERILIAPKFAGGDLKLTAGKTLPNVNNLWIASPQLHPQKNILGSILNAELLIGSLGFKESGIEIPELSTTPALNVEIS